MYVCMYVFMYVCIYVCMYAYIYIYIIHGSQACLGLDMMGSATYLLPGPPGLLALPRGDLRSVSRTVTLHIHTSYMYTTTSNT